MQGLVGLKLKVILYFIISGIIHVSTNSAAEVTMTASGASRLEYNDNIMFSRTNPDDDMILLIRPGLDLGYKTEQLELSSEISADILRYKKHSNLNGEYVSLDMEGRLNPVERLQLNAGISGIKDTTLDSELQETGILITRDNRMTLNADGGVSYNINEQSDVGIAYSFAKIDYDSENNTGYKGDSISLTYNRRMMNMKDVFTLQPYCSRNDSGMYNVENLGLYGGWARQINETWSLSAALGVRRTKTSYLLGNLFLWEEKKWGGLADISLKKSCETWGVDVGLNRDLSYSTYGDPIETDRLNLELRKDISEALSGIISVSLSKSESDSNLSRSLRRDSWYLSINPSLRYKIAKRIRLDLSYSYSYDNNRLLKASRGVDRDIFRIALNYGFLKQL